MVKTQSGKIVKRVRTDNGGEFKSHDNSDIVIEQVHTHESSHDTTMQQSEPSQPTNSADTHGKGPEAIVSSSVNSDNVSRHSGRIRRQPKHLENYEVELPSSIDHSRPVQYRILNGTSFN